MFKGTTTYWDNNTFSRCLKAFLGIMFLRNTPCGSEITTFGFFNLLGNTDLFTSYNRISKDNHLNTKSTD